MKSFETEEMIAKDHAVGPIICSMLFIPRKREKVNEKEPKLIYPCTESPCRLEEIARFDGKCKWSPRDLVPVWVSPVSPGKCSAIVKSRDQGGRGRYLKHHDFDAIWYPTVANSDRHYVPWCSPLF